MVTECTLAALSRVDLTDPIATQALLDSCISLLLAPETWLWAIAFTIGSAAVGAAIGWWRDGRWLAGLVWGLVLGPLGWLVTAFGPSRVRKDEPASSRQAKTPRNP